jgi:hypothetical protein
LPGGIFGSRGVHDNYGKDLSPYEKREGEHLE